MVLREQAREMRCSGESIKVIAAKLNKSVGTVHGWVKDIELPEEVKQQLRKRGAIATGKLTREAREQRLAQSQPTPAIRGLPSYNPKAIGEKSTAQIIALFLMADLVVLTPFGDNQRYDLVVEDKNIFIRVQCKTAQFLGDHFKFLTCSSNWKNTKRSYKGNADVFAVYLRERHEVYIFNVNNAPNIVCTVRLLPCRQTKYVRMAQPHLFVPGKSLLVYP